METDGIYIFFREGPVVFFLEEVKQFMIGRTFNVWDRITQR